ncbi:DUF342 domain-containing protein [Dissulfurirhabdus thermomarina]|uniref:DUF342 domain-containing protein n=1 Tax=Dissulfurirhabdus thermomarina TaxID=1765737 RepID=A0A6N9TLU5_DISTH|nr:FapA family protein [Dissulfurirhabdus thermomarina]NDY42008.1 DUF342 domain-containing protein [Dissulfurirhabdus thermomarina]NMX24007.1 DUF342 domain-containing protein [Dissulfurirhabdus thermomarina]
MTPEELTNGVFVLDGALKLKVSKDRMEAVASPVEGELTPELERVLPQVLDEAGIVHGRLPVPERTRDGWVVARGTPPEKGEDGTIEYLVRLPDGRPVMRPPEEGEGDPDAGPLYVDPNMLNLVVNVREGETIARKVPPTPGVPGQDVFGGEIPAKPGQYAAFKPGAGVEISQDGMTMVAALSGKIELEGEGKISVRDEWTLEGDVDAGTGHIEFIGRHMKISGSVQHGFRVQVEGDLEVGKDIEDGAHVEVRGSLDVGGIIRAAKTVIKVGGVLTCQSIEYADVTVGGRMEVKDYVLDATCRVRGDVQVVEGKGQIAGGAVYAGGSLEAKVFGTSANVPTRISVGRDLALEERYEKVVAEVETWGAKLKEVKKGLAALAAMEAKGPLGRKPKFIKDRLTDLRPKIEARLREATRLLAEMEPHLVNKRDARARALVKAYAKTVVEIKDVRLHLDRNVEQPVEFRFRDGEVQVAPIQAG